MRAVFGVNVKSLEERMSDQLMIKSPSYLSDQSERKSIKISRVRYKRSEFYEQVPSGNIYATTPVLLTGSPSS